MNPAKSIRGVHPLYLVLSALLLGFLSYLEWASVLGFILLTPLIFGVFLARSLTESALKGLIYGAAYLVAAYAWVVPSYSARWSGLDVYSAAGSLSVVIIVTIFCCALLFGVFAAGVYAVYHLLAGRTVIHVGACVVLIAAWFTITEYLREPLFALITLGPGGTESFYTSGFLGYLLSSFEGLRLLAGIGEVYVLTFLVVAVNAVLAFALISRSHILFIRTTLILAGVLILGNSALMLATPEHNHTVSVLGVATDVRGGVPEHLREVAAQEAFAATGTRRAEADLIVFAETYGISVAYAASDEEAPILASRRVDRGETAAFIAGIHKNGTAPWYAEKRILVPYGEYVPYLARWIGTLIDAERTQALVRSLNAIPGDETRRVARAADTSVGMLFCNEAWAPHKGAVLREQGAELAVVIASHASFEYPALLEAQEERILKVRAAALRMPLVQVTNRGRSYVIDAGGALVGRYEAGESFLAEVPLSRRP